MNNISKENIDYLEFEKKCNELLSQAFIIAEHNMRLSHGKMDRKSKLLSESALAANSALKTFLAVIQLQDR